MKKRSHFLSINELQTWLFQIPMFSKDGIKAIHYSLENMEAALNELGNPQHNFAV
jgi:folylpolyglutamate synthase/dihydropteroate synthase